MMLCQKWENLSSEKNFTAGFCTLEINIMLHSEPGMS